MILGISSFTYGWSIGVNGSPSFLKEQDLIYRTKKFGLRCLQLGDNLPLHRLTSDQLSEVKKDVKDANIRLEIGARGLTESHLERYIALAAFFESPLLRFVVDGIDYQPEIRTIVSILKNSIPELKRNNLTLGIENHDRFQAEQLSEMMEEISDDRIGVCLDTVNSIGAGEGIAWVAQALAPFTVNLHIKDFIIRRFENNMGFTVAGSIAGKGMLDLRMVMEKLSVHNRCQSAVLEQWVPGSNKLEDTIEIEKQWAEQSISALKQLPYFT
jgi:3-oxoisoapionate decarboxylase